MMISYDLWDNRFIVSFIEERPPISFFNKGVIFLVFLQGEFPTIGQNLVRDTTSNF